MPPSQVYKKRNKLPKATKLVKNACAYNLSISTVVLSTQAEIQKQSMALKIKETR